MGENYNLEFSNSPPDILKATSKALGMSYRVFTGLERFRLSLEAQDYLWKIYQLKVLPSVEFEELILYLLSLDQPEIELTHVQWAIEQVVTDATFATLLSGAFPRYYWN